MGVESTTSISGRVCSIARKVQLRVRAHETPCRAEPRPYRPIQLCRCTRLDPS